MHTNHKHAQNSSIKCGVSTCHYYSDNYCTAAKIEVNPLGDGVAKTSDGTSCSTFIPESK